MSTTYRDFMNSIIAESRKNNVPYIGNIELTGCCNLACEMCYVIHEIGGRDLSTAEWNTLLEDAAKAGMGEAYLSGGEPLKKYIVNCMIKVFALWLLQMACSLILESLIL